MDKEKIKRAKKDFDNLKETKLTIQFYDQMYRYQKANKDTGKKGYFYKVNLSDPLKVTGTSLLKRMETEQYTIF